MATLFNPKGFQFANLREKSEKDEIVSEKLKGPRKFELERSILRLEKNERR
jgi:hypothetical protein